MKKILPWVYLAAMVVLLVVLLMMGLKIADGKLEDVPPLSYVVAGCFAVMLPCALYRIIANRCPHCHHVVLVSGRYCPHCGKER